MKKTKHILLINLLLFTFIFIGSKSTAEIEIEPYIPADTLCDDYINYIYSDSIMMLAEQKDSIKQLMIDEVDKYINKQTTKSPDHISEYIVEKCLENDIQVAFAISQTHLETCFGTTGIGKTRHSLFGVMKSYPSYEAAVDGYVSLLKKQYLVNGKTEEMLLKHYVSKGGYRYGSSSYEVDLRKYYNKVKTNTNLIALQQEYKNIEIME